MMQTTKDAELAKVCAGILSTLSEHMPPKLQKASVEKAVKLLTELQFLTEGGPGREEVHAMYELLCKSRNSEAGEQELDLLYGAVTNVVSSCGGHAGVKRKPPNVPIVASGGPQRCAALELCVLQVEERAVVTAKMDGSKPEMQFQRSCRRCAAMARACHAASTPLRPASTRCGSMGKREWRRERCDEHRVRR